VIEQDEDISTEADNNHVNGDMHSFSTTIVHMESNSPAMQSAISDALGLAEMLMLRIDNRWHATPDQRMNPSRAGGV
jgi:hypothetical protein